MSFNNLQKCCLLLDDEFYTDITDLRITALITSLHGSNMKYRTYIYVLQLYMYCNNKKSKNKTSIRPYLHMAGTVSNIK